MSLGHKEDGFVLSEALASLALAAIVGAGLIAALTSSSSRAAEARARASALRVAEVQLSEALDGAVRETSQGVSDGLAWRITRTPHPKFYGAEIVRASVIWHSPRREGEIELEAICTREPQTSSSSLNSTNE